MFWPIHLQQLEKVPFDMILHNDFFFLRIVVFHSSFCCSTVSQAPFIVETVENFHSDRNKKIRKHKNKKKPVATIAPSDSGLQVTIDPLTVRLGTREKRDADRQGNVIDI